MAGVAGAPYPPTRVSRAALALSASMSFPLWRASHWTWRTIESMPVNN